VSIIEQSKSEFGINDSPWIEKTLDMPMTGFSGSFVTIVPPGSKITPAGESSEDDYKREQQTPKLNEHNEHSRR